MATWQKKPKRKPKYTSFSLCAFKVIRDIAMMPESKMSTVIMGIKSVCNFIESMTKAPIKPPIPAKCALNLTRNKAKTNKLPMVNVDPKTYL